MQGMSEDEGDDDDAPEVKFDEEKARQARKARTDREEALRKMMEESGKPNSRQPTLLVTDIYADEEMADSTLPDPTPVGKTKDFQDAEEADAPVTTAENTGAGTAQGGRRRGKRKVTKRKKVKDEEGYLGEPHFYVLAQ